MDQTSAPRTDAPSDPEQWLDAHGDYLYRYALKRLRNAEVAEDMVQETFVAALRARERFSGKSSERTWLVGILKHKIIDHIRKSTRERPVSDLDLDEDQTEALFSKGGHWKVKPARWSYDPRVVTERSEFRRILQQCIDGLPRRLADVFVLREMDQLETDEVCKELEITPTNLWVILHRARSKLRRCLEINWFGGKKR